MRRDLVEEVLDAVQEELFEDVLYTPVGGPQVTVAKSIFGIEPATEQFDSFGGQIRVGTHVTRAIKAKFPALARGDLINDGTSYKVQDFVPTGDGRYEILISLVIA